jgi:hypothetical protein
VDEGEDGAGAGVDVATRADAELRALEPVQVAAGTVRDDDAAGHIFSTDVRSGLIEMLDASKIPAQRRIEHVRAPRVEGHAEHLVVGRRP